MSATKRLTNITQAQISNRGVQALANRPNSPSTYGVGGLDAKSLKLWFDKLGTFLAEKINALQDTISSADAGEYIRVVLDSYNVENLKDLVDSFTNGTFAKNILKLCPSASETTKQTLQAIIDDVAQDISTHYEELNSLNQNKLSKVTDNAIYKRAYMIDTDGTQKVIYICESPIAGAIPMFTSNGQLNVAFPVENTHAVDKDYSDTRDRLLGSTVDLSIDSQTYVMTLKLKNTAGAVLSTTSIDLPLESFIMGGSYANGVLTLKIRNEDGHIDNNSINIDISDLIDGLVNTATFNTQVDRLDGRVDQSNQNLQAFISEIELSKIYAHAAFHAEESQTARNYTKGGGIDKKFKKFDFELSAGGGLKIELGLDSDYKLTVSLKNKKGEVISSGVVDFPIEGLITTATYANKTLTLTLQNGNKVNIGLGDIISGLVPETRKINGKTLSADIVLSADDIGAYPKNSTYTRTEVGNLITSKVSESKIELQSQMVQAIEEKQVVGYGYYAQEADVAGGYTLGGKIDKELKEIKRRLNTLETN